MYRAGIDDPRQGPRAGWAHLSGTLDLEAFPRDPVEAEDKSRIDLLLGRYGWAIDERIPRLLGDCFAATAVVDRQIEEGHELPRLTGREAIVEAHRAAWGYSPWGQSRRFLDVGLSGRRDDGCAVTLSRWVVTGTNEVGSKVSATGFELAELTRQGSRWDIARLLIGYDRPVPAGVF